MEGELTPEEEEMLARDYTEDYRGLGVEYPTEKEKHGVFQFLNKVFKTKDSTKVGFMNEEELIAFRIFKNASLYSEKMGLATVKDFLDRKAELVVAPTLSRGGNLVLASITTKKEFQARLKTPQKQNKGWFKSKSKPQEVQGV
jgi:hypothetical protein